VRLYVTFGSTYGALRAESLLRAAAISCGIVPKPREIRGSCGLAVRIDLDDAEPALAILAAAHHCPRQQVTLR
jgi:hypothetical protein